MTNSHRHQILGCTIVLRHILQAFVVLTLSPFVHPFYFLDITNGRQFDPMAQPVYSKSPSIRRENWEPGSFWFRNKRSVLGASTLSPGPFSSPLATELMNFQSPAASNSFQKLIGGSTNKLLKKMRQISEIKASLRRRDKLRKLETESSKLEQFNQKMFTDQPEDVDDELIPIKNSKSRRTEMMVASRRMRDQSRNSRLPPSMNIWFSGKDEFPYSDSQSQYAGDVNFAPSSFSDSFSPENRRLEIFPIKQPANIEDVGFFDSGQSLGQLDQFDDGFHSSSSFSLPSFDESNPISDFQDSFIDDPFSYFSESPHSPGSSQEKDFTQWGAFSDDDKDCPTIATKSCASGADCSCNGFYTCRQGRCELLQPTNPREVVDTPAEIWHDKPVDFDLYKFPIIVGAPEEQVDSNEGDIQKRSVDSQTPEKHGDVDVQKRSVDVEAQSMLSKADVQKTSAEANVEKRSADDKAQKMLNEAGVQKRSVDDKVQKRSIGDGKTHLLHTPVV